MAKITKRERFVEILAIVGEDTDLGEFVKGEIALLDKRADAKRGKTKTQLANEDIKVDIVDVLTANGALRAGDIAKTLDLAVQKITALLRQLVTEGTVVREVDGKATLFKVAE